MTYVRAESISEAISLLADNGPDARILAGGQSLIPIMSAGLARPSLLIDVMQIQDAPRLALEGDHVRIGFRARHIDVERADNAIATAAPLLPAAAPFVGNRAVRNRGTVVGSVAHADPAGEWPAVGIALDATAHLRSRTGSRRVRIADLILGPMWADLAPDEMITAITVPVARIEAGHSAGAGVYELAHRRGDYAIVGCVAQAVLDPETRIVDARFALFGLGNAPWRSIELDQGLTGARRSDIPELTAEIPDRIDTVTDAKASAGYRRRVSGVVTARALTRAFDDALSGLASG